MHDNDDRLNIRNMREAQEKAGQTMLVTSDALPTQMRGCTRDDLEKLGFVFGGNIDDLFVAAQLPPGWTKKATENVRVHRVLDDKGRKRFGIFYKAAFYDRNAYLAACTRYRLDPYGEVDDVTRVVCLVDHDGSVIRDFGKYKNGDYETLSEIENKAIAWLNKEMPKWKNPFAYWT